MKTSIMKPNRLKSGSNFWGTAGTLQTSLPKKKGDTISLKLMVKEAILQDGICLKIKPGIGLCYYPWGNEQSELRLGGLSEEDNCPIWTF